MTHIVLVGCGSEKIATAAAARSLYTGTLFTSSLAYAERLKPDAIYIVSAFHGLVELDAVIEPYDRTLTGTPVKERLAWGQRIAEALRGRHHEPDVRLTILAGAIYADAIEWGLRWRNGERSTWQVEMPLQGLPIGQRLRRLKQLNAGEIQ
jgi:hypothetical protein